MKAAVGEAYRQLKGYPLVIFGVCLFAWTLGNMDQSLFGYAIPGIREDFGASLEDVGWILFGSFVFAAFLGVGIGILADHYGRRIMLVLLLGASAFLVGIHALAPTLIALGVLRALAFGLSNALSPITNTYVVEASPKRYRGLMTGLLQCGYPLGWFIASIFAAPLMAIYGWRSIFLLAFAVVPLAWVIGRFLPESERFKNKQQTRPAAASRPTALANIKELFGPALRRRTILIAIMFFTYGGAYSGTAFYFPTFYNEFRGYSMEAATTLVGLSYGLGVVGYVASAIIGEFYLTRRNTTVIWLWLGAFSLLGLIWLPTSYTQDVIWFGLMATFFYGTNGVIATLLTEAFPTRIRATGAALAGSFAINVGFAVYPVLVAKAIETFGWQWAFTAAVFPSLVIAGLAILGLENIRSGLDVDEIAR